MNKKEIIERWNSIADEYNQYDKLSLDEKIMLLMGADDVSDSETEITEEEEQ